MVLFEDTVPPPVPLVDGADPVTTGTGVDESWYNALDASLDAQLHSATDPTATPASAIAEIHNARSGEPNLLTRLTAMEAAFTGVGPAAVRNGFVLGNLLANDSFLMWSRGDSAAPDFWTLSGTGAAVARCGVGLGDTTVIGNQAHFAAKLTYGSAAAVLAQNAWEPSVWSALRGAVLFRYLPVDRNNDTLAGYSSDEQQIYGYLIGHVSASAVDKACVALYDGSNLLRSDYHPGTPGPPSFQTLIAGPFTPASSVLQAQCRMEGTGSAYFQCLSLLLTPLELKPMYVPGRARYKVATLPWISNPATGTIGYLPFSRPAHILGAQMSCLTAGTVSAPTLDLLTPIGGTWSSLFSTLPTIATGQLHGAPQACDGTYRRRTIRPVTAAQAALQDNSALRVDYADDGGGTLRDLIVTVHYLEFDRPFEQFRGTSDIGE